MTVSAETVLSSEELAAKNYPLPKDYEVKSVYETYDTSVGTGSGTLSTEEGTYYDEASLKMVSIAASNEKTALKEVSLNGVGFMFWYKSDSSHIMRIRNSATTGIIAEATLPACSEGTWITYYYYGKCENFTFKTDMNSDIRTNISSTATYKVNFMTWSAGSVLYIDEFYTFTPKITPADTYDNDSQAFKFSIARVDRHSATVADYYDDGSVELASTYGATTSNTPVNITYNADIDQFKKAVAVANEGSGYLQIKCDNISCFNSSGEDTYAKITLTFNGIDKTISNYSYGAGTSDIYLLDVSDLTDEMIDLLTTVNVTISGSSIKNVDFKLSPITVYEFPKDELILQAEDLNPAASTGSADITTSADKNRTYVYAVASNNDSSYSFVTFTLPELEVGEYEVYAAIYATTTTSKFNISVNNLRQLMDVSFSDATYASYKHNTTVPIGTIKITKDYADGASVLKLTRVPQKTAAVYIDYFSFKKTDTQVKAEPSSNFVIKDYPEIKDHEVKTVIHTYDSYICSADYRFYQSTNIAGYVGDGNAFNLNSRGTRGNLYSDDSNYIWSGTAGKLSGDGLRFWYKGGQGWLRLYHSSGYYIADVPATDGDWVTIYYKDIVSNGDLSGVKAISLVRRSILTNAYIDELHVIQENLGEVLYEVNSDGKTASVIGYDLRLEDVEILSEYNGCPVTTIREGALAGTLTLRTVTIPDTVTTIEAGAFKDDPNLSSVIFGSGVTAIADSAFQNCEKLTDVTLPANIASISDTAFSGCTSLYININSDYCKSYAAKNSIDYVDVTDEGLVYYFDFDETNTVRIIGYTGTSERLTVPSTIDGATVVELADGCFENNTVITSLILPDTITSVGEAALKNCTSVISVTMNGVTDIGESAFNGCSALTSVSVSDALLTIGKSAFYNCSEIELLYFGDNITSIGDNAFYNCDFVADLSDNAYIDRDNYSYTYVNSNGFINYPTTTSKFKYYIINEIATIYGYSGSDTVLTIPAKIDDYVVHNISEGAFKGNTAITSLTFEGNVRNINEYAFNSCSNLSSVKFENALRTIAAYSFTDCPKLLAVTINDIVSVHENAFDGTTVISREETNFVRSALDYVDGMTAGWNLGNTLDAHSKSYSYGDITVAQSESLWRHSGFIKQNTFDLVAEHFNTIRIPITWNAFIDPDNDFAIDKEYMDRIEEVVDMCYTAGFEYIIINTHHDSDYYFNPHSSNTYLSKVEYVVDKVWSQIAERFKNYDEKLIFESFNEIRAIAADGSADWYGQDTNYYTILNNMNKAFYNTVRNSGGNNDKRYLMIQSYGGQRDARQVGAMWLPSVEEDNHIIGSIHWYIESLTESHYTAIIQRCNSRFIDNGIPCVIGEIGMPRWYDDDYREQWAELAFTLFEENNLKAIIWDDHGDYSCTYYDEDGKIAWKYPKYVAKISELTSKENTKYYNVTIDGEIYKTVASGKRFELPKSTDSGFVAYNDGTNYYDEGAYVRVNEDISFTTVSVGSVTMEYGASIRLNEKAGIRFYTAVDTEKITSLKKMGATVETGTLIAHAGRLGTYDLNFDVSATDSDGNIVWTKLIFDSEEYFEDETGFKGVVGSIVDIKDTNINTEFIGRGYITVTFGDYTKTVYADYADNNIHNNSRSIGYIAYRFKADTAIYNKLTDDRKALVDKWAKKFNDPAADDIF